MGQLVAYVRMVAFFLIIPFLRPNQPCFPNLFFSHPNVSSRVKGFRIRKMHLRWNQAIHVRVPKEKKKEIPSDQDKKKETTMRRIRRRVLSRLREDGDAKRRTKIGSENIRSSSEPFPCTSRDHVLLSTSHVRINRVDRATNERNGSPRGRFRARTFAG